MSSPSLESLSDSELSEVFAREVAGWRLGDKKKVQYSGYWYDAEGVVTNLGVHNLKFATSADAVIAYLEKASRERLMFVDSIWFDKMGEYWSLEGHVPNGHRRQHTLPINAIHASFARAACIALIKAHRAAKAP